MKILSKSKYFYEIEMQMISCHHLDNRGVCQHIDFGKTWPFFTDHNFKYIFFIENDKVLIKMSTKFVTKGPINNKSESVLTMVCLQP